MLHALSNNKHDSTNKENVCVSILCLFTKDFYFDQSQTIIIFLVLEFY